MYNINTNFTSNIIGSNFDYYNDGDIIIKYIASATENIKSRDKLLIKSKQVHCYDTDFSCLFYGYTVINIYSGLNYPIYVLILLYWTYVVIVVVLYVGIHWYRNQRMLAVKYVLVILLGEVDLAWIVGKMVWHHSDTNWDSTLLNNHLSFIFLIPIVRKSVPYHPK